MSDVRTALPITRRTVCLALGAIGLTGCSRTPANVLRVSFAPLQYAPLYERLAAAFERMNPGTFIRLEGAADYDGLLAQTLRSALAGDTVSVSHQGMGHVAVLADRGLAVPLGQFAGRTSEQPQLDKLTPVRADGRALPFAISAPVLFFNADLVQSAGGRPDSLPSDWPNILELARAIQSSAGKLGVYFDYSGPNVFSFQALLFSAGGRFMDPAERHVELGSPHGAWALEQVRQFGLAGQIDMTREQAKQSFAAGNLGIYQAASSSLASLEKHANGRFTVRMRPFPIPSVAGGIPAGGSAIVMLERNSEKQQLAWKYISYVRSATAQTLLPRSTGYLPVEREALAEHRVGLSNPNELVALEQLPRLRPWYVFPGQNSRKITDLIRDDLQQVITLRELPSVALRRMARRTERLLSL